MPAAPRLGPVPTGEGWEGEVRVTHTIFAAEDGTFAVLAAEDPADGGELVLTGPIAHLSVGSRATVAGTWQEHPRHGPQLKVTEASELDPPDARGAMEYLTSIRRIGPARARALLGRHGSEVFATIDADPHAAFTALPRMPAGQAAEAATSWRERRALRDLVVLLAPHGIARLAPRLHERHGPAAINLVREDPFGLTELHGVGFATADRIARSVGVPADSPRRQHAAAMHLLTEAEGEGHSYLPRNGLLDRVRSLIDVAEPERIDELVERGSAVDDGGDVYRTETWELECRLAERLAELSAAGPAFDADPGAAAPEGPSGPGSLSAEQWEAVRVAFTRRISVVTGGPGTGKTTLVRAIVEQAQAAKLRIELCAPTGRAARRLSEATGHRARTIHRLLEWIPGEGPARDETDPLRCDLLIVDESSMLSLTIASVLAQAVGPSTHLVLVGDADQLPPVGAGKPFAELIESGSVPIVRLGHVFRQAARSMIVSAAHAINTGTPPATTPGPEQERDFFLMAEPDADRAADLVVELATSRLPEHYGVDPLRDIQVLSPIYRGSLGVDELNRRIRDVLNPDGEPVLSGALRDGDKLIQTRNDYESGLMNGQIAHLVGDDAQAGEMRLITDEHEALTLPHASAGTLRPAYAISVHKSQGAEVPVVIVPVHRSHWMLLSRNLVYTAITRASRVCVLVGDPGALNQAIARADSHRRFSGLSARIAAAGTPPLGEAG
ncbi:MAG: SF1B family DNA helicase RecD2 [Solirubrobacterales bacterium]